MSLFAAWLLLLAGLLLAGLLLLWVLAPLREGGALPAADDARLLALLTEREGSLAGLRDLDADLAAGRISPSVHLTLREEVLAGGSRVVAALDESLERVAGDRQAALARLEVAVARQRGQEAPSATADLAAAPAAGDLQPRLLTCPSCGRVTDFADRFCRHCGHDLRKGKPV